MASTVNGLIAKEDDSTDFTSDAGWETFKKKSQEIGNLIIGRNTYLVMEEEKDFDNFTDLPVVVVSRDAEFKPERPNTFVVNNCKSAIELLNSKNFTSCLVAGGGMVNTSFMKDKLVDELFIDVEPQILGKGIKLFSEADFSTNLKLLNVSKLSDNTVQLHYEVSK